MNVVEFPQSRCRVGVARCDITPPVGIYHRMWGAATHDRSTGIHRPLTATVLVLRRLDGDSSNQRVAIAVDHCLLWTAEMSRLLQQVSEKAEIPVAQMTVFFSHTHGAGLMGMERTELPGGDLIPPYLAELADKISQLIVQATDQLQPATIVYGKGRSDLATNRDHFDEARGHAVCGYEPEGFADDTIIVARITSDGGATLATLVNYACHPTTLAWENTLISPDYIGAMREVIEAATDAPCFFIQGASGDIGPREGFVGDVNVADRNGRRLGYASLAAIEGLAPPGQRFVYVKPVISGATLGVWEFQSESADRIDVMSAWEVQTVVVPIKYRKDIPVKSQLEKDLIHWRSIESAANAAGNGAEARDARAMIERTTRRLVRVASLPEGDSYPYVITACRIGDAIWLAYDGEHYNLLQTTLRQAFPDHTLIIGTIANGSSVWYLPDARSFGKGLYQEEVSILEKGCLEQVIDASIELVRALTNRAT